MVRGIDFSSSGSDVWAAGVGRCGIARATRDGLYATADAAPADRWRSTNAAGAGPGEADDCARHQRASHIGTSGSAHRQAGRSADGGPDGCLCCCCDAVGTPKRGGTLRAVIQNDFVTMLPIITTGPTANQCFDWLVRWRKGDDGVWGPQPGLAESWELRDNAATFKLRKGVKFHDGSDLNADAVVWYIIDLWIKHPKSMAKTDFRASSQGQPCRGRGRLHRQDQPEGAVRLVARRRSRTAPRRPASPRRWRTRSLATMA